MTLVCVLAARTSYLIFNCTDNFLTISEHLASIAKVEKHASFYGKISSVASPRGTCLRTHSREIVIELERGEKKCPAPSGIRTLSLMIIRSALYRCATTKKSPKSSTFIRRVVHRAFFGKLNVQNNFNLNLLIPLITAHNYSRKETNYPRFLCHCWRQSVS